MKKLLTTGALLLCSLMTFAQFSGSGSGTSSDPYRIFNADQLTQLRNFLNQEGVYFKLQNDIDLTEWLADNYPSQGWQPVGSSSEPFKGILDGNNKTISGFSITRSSTDYVGLFAYVTGATIKDLTLKGNISGKSYVGSLLGRGSATVTNYTFEGNVTGTGDYVGGVGGVQLRASTNLTVKATVLGASYTGGVYGHGVELSSVSFTGQVTSSTSSSYTGGLEGSGMGTFSSCTVSAPVTGGCYIGGLVGSFSGDMTNCSQTGEVKSISSSGSYVGGLVGLVNSISFTITNGVHRGKVTGGGDTGGVVGFANSALTLTSCYAEGDIIGSTYVGGICGRIKNPSASAIISGCNFWGDISGTSHLGGIVGQIEATSTLSNVDFTTSVTAGYKAAPSDYKYYWNTDCFYNTSSPNLIATTSGGCVAQSSIATDIDAWVNSTHLVYTSTSTTNNTTTAPYIVYQNIRGTNTAVNINIQNCSAIGNINGTGAYIGGIVGKDVDEDNASYSSVSSKTVYYYKGNGTSSNTTSLTLKKYDYRYTISNISESYFSGTISGTNYLGGIAGNKQGGCINNCYASASISGGQYLGGIAGSLRKYSYDNNENSMNANVSACSRITGTSNVGRIYGDTDGSFTVAALGTNSENRSMASTQVVMNGVTQTITDNLQNGTAVGISQLRLRANYVAWGWDFNNYWTIQETEGFPYKTWQSAPPTFSGKLSSGATSISGKSIDGGNVHLATSSGKTYTATCSGSNWSVNVDALHAGETVTMYAAGTDKEKSYFTTTTVGFQGSGTESDPYQIASAEDLQGIYTGGYYIIMNDINLTSWINQYSSSKGWVPVGYDGAAVYINGDGHKISGLWTNSTDTYTGLFSKLKDGYIKNLNVEVASGKKVKGGEYTGIIIGYATNFEMSNCSVKGDAEGTKYVGGLAGYFTGNSSNPNLSALTYEGFLSSTTASAIIGGIAGFGLICRMTNVSSTIQVTSTGNSSMIGGLVGWMCGSVSQCSADVNITASGTGCKVGGLFGTAGFDNAVTNISESYSTGTIQVTGSDSWTGGIAGSLDNNCQLSDSYSTATISGTLYTAGLVGQAFSASKINRCYASGNLTGVYYGAGIVGYLNGANTKTTNCVALNNILSYTDQSAWACRVIGGYDEASGDPDGSNLALATMQVSLNNVPVRKYDDLVEGIAKSEAVLKQAATYEAMGWDFNEVWGINEGERYPYLLWNNPYKEEQTLELVELPNMTYGDDVYTLPATTTEGQSLTWTSSNTSVASISGNVLTIFGAGTTTVTAVQEGNNLYAPFSREYTLTVAKATLTITANNCSKQQGEENPELTVSYNGFKYNDNAASLTTQPTVTTTATTNSPVGSYPITVSGAASANYEFTYVNGTLTVVDETALNNTIACSNITARSGQQIELPIVMTNDANLSIVGISFTLSLPEGVTVEEDEGEAVYTLVSSRLNPRRFTVYTIKNSDGSWGFRISVNNQTAVLNGTEGEIMTITLNIADGMGAGEYGLSLTENKLSIRESNNNVQTKTISNSESVLTISNVIMGDVNGDGDVDLSDAIMVTYYSLHVIPTNFIEAAADMNSDGDIDLSDAIIIIYKSLGVLQSRSMHTFALTGFDNDQLTLGGSGTDYGVLLTNDDSYLGFQCDIKLPDDVGLESVSLSESRADGHTIIFGRLEDGSYRVVAFSVAGKPFFGNMGKLFSFTTEGTTQGEVSIKNIFFVNTGLQKRFFDDLTTHATGIASMETVSDGAPLYDMLGRRIDETKTLRKDVYISRGAKTVIKR